MQSFRPDPRFVLVLALAALTTFMPWPQGSTSTVDRSIRIEARDFAFTPASVEVRQGDQVTIELVSGDYVHGLQIRDYDLNLIAEPGRPARATFTADRPGTFRLRCSVTCGSLHPFMAGQLRVGPPIGLLRTLVLAALAVLAGALTVSRPASVTTETRRTQ